MSLYTIPAIWHFKTGIFNTPFNPEYPGKKARNYPHAIGNNDLFVQNKRVDNVL